MNPWLHTIWTVARWEFFRYFKLKDQIVGLVRLLIGAAIGYGAVVAVRSSSKIEVAVIGTSAKFALPDNGQMVLADGNRSQQQWRELVEAGELDGLLVISASNESPWAAKLTVRQEPAWLEQLRPVLQNERIQWQIEAANIDSAELAQVLAPVEVQIDALADQGISKSDKLLAYGILAAMVLTSWIALAYMMTGITGEKQQRVTEQIVSAIRPQMWIDGKLIGITAAAIGSLAFMFVTSLICFVAAWVMGANLVVPQPIQRWEFLPLLLGFYLGGVLFWNCFYAGITSVINDPNTSSRTSLLFLPMLPMIAVGLAAAQPDSLMMKTLSLLPGTSSAAMPMRLVLGQVTTLEIILSFAMMIVGIAGLRLIAGRIFAAGIMLYGKEPSWLDIARWTVKPLQPADAYN